MSSSFMSKFRVEMEKLGAHPDKNIITTLTVSADRHRHRAPEIVDLIARAVLSSRIPPANRLPLCYLMDSVLKNVGEPYIGMFGAHVAAMACRTYEHGTVRDRQCILKLLRTWKERALFSHSTVSNIDSFIDRLEKGAYIPQERRPDERRTPPLPPPHEPMPPHDPLPPHEPIYGGGGSSSRHRAGVDGRRDGRDRRNRDGGRDRRERERDFYPPELPSEAPPPLPPVQLPSRASQSRPGEKDRRPPPSPHGGPPSGPGPSVYDPPGSSVYDPPPLEPEVGDKRRPEYTGGGGTDPRQAKRPHHTPYAGRDRPPPPGPPPPPPPRHDPYLPPEPLPPQPPQALRPPPPPMPPQPQLPAPPPPPPPLFTVPPVAKDIHFVIAVEKEMRTMLEAMVSELGEKPMSIEELAKRSPQTAEDFKKAAEATVAYRIQMAAIEAEKAKGPFHEPLSGPTDYDAAREVVNRIKRRLLELHANPAQMAATRPELLSAAAQSAAQLEAMIQTMEASATLLATPKPAALSAADQLMTKAALQAFAQQMVLQQQQQQQQQQAPPQPATPSGAQQLLSSLLGLVPAAPATQQPETSSGLGPFTSESVSKKIPWVIHALHQGDQCPEDGRRFTSKEQLQEHLDWHFRKNEKARETGGKRDKGIKSRPWLLTVSAWVAQPRPSQLLLTNGEKAQAVTSTSAAKTNGTGASQQPQVQAVPADASYPDCRLCGEPFEQFWDEGAQMFMYSGVVKVLVGEGRLLRVDPGMEVPPGSRLIPVHQLCFQAAPSQEAVELLQARRSSSIGVTPMVEG